MLVVAQLLVLLAAASAQQCRSSTPQNSYIDITVTTGVGLPVWASSVGLRRNWRARSMAIAEGDEVNQSWLNFDAHTGTHIDSPAHFVNEHDFNNSVEKLPVELFIGPALVAEVPPNTNVTGPVLAALDIPADLERLILLTDNTRKRLMFQAAFDTSYTALTPDGARWLVEHTNVKLIGIDYLSIATYETCKEGHVILFHKGIVPIEGLDLTQVQPGRHHLICLPAKLQGSDGAPVRCVLAQQ